MGITGEFSFEALSSRVPAYWTTTVTRCQALFTYPFQFHTCLTSSGCVQSAESQARTISSCTPEPRDTVTSQKHQVQGCGRSRKVACVHVAPPSLDSSTRSMW